MLALKYGQVATLIDVSFIDFKHLCIKFLLHKVSIIYPLKRQATYVTDDILIFFVLF